jgi:octaprenyl-diphosphate synthase
MLLTAYNDIKAPVAEELNQFERRFKEAMQSPVPLLDKITTYIYRRKGKQIRPTFVFLTAKMIGEVNESTFTAANMVELLHTATLVHDDVVDDSDERRGFFSINALWKNKIAVLVGDFLLSRGLLTALDNQEYDLLHILSNAVKEMSEGELLQIEKARRLDIDESVYYEVIRKKTASLMAAACGSGAVSVTTDKELIARAKLFGEKAGLAFQIRDDLFDYGTDDIGKPVGNDIKEKKMTLPLIYALKKADFFTRHKIIRTVKNNDNRPERVAYVIDFVKKSGGLEYAKLAMMQLREEAKDILYQFPENEARRSLESLLDYVIERKK